MKIVDKVITIEELQQMSEKMFGQIVKAVVDIEKEIMKVIDEELEEFKGLAKDVDPKNWQEAALDRAFKSAASWGGTNTGAMKDVINEWYRRHTLLGAYRSNERGEDL